jgi:uncharacterized protein YecT (DUF1311 family)
MIVVRTSIFVLLIAGATVVPCVASSTEYREADAELNSNYERVMSAVPPPRREQLRNAERAWLDFAVCNLTALRASAPHLRIDAETVEHFGAAELRNRTMQLAMISGTGRRGDEGELTLERTEEELNVVYQRCLVNLSKSEATKLREAQRAWIVFRDANRMFGQAMIKEITADRVTQLNNFYVSWAKPDDLTQPVVDQPEPTPQKADRTVPDPFERAR